MTTPNEFEFESRPDLEPGAVETDTIRNIHFDGRIIEMGPHAANPAWLHIRADDDESAEYFSSLDISLPPSVALAFGKALITAATELGAR